MEDYDSHTHWFLADRTNSRTYAALLRPSAWCQSVFYFLSVVYNVCIVAKRCILEQKLLLTAQSHIGSHMWGIDWYQNEWPWTLFRGRLRSCRPMPHICHWIWRKTLEIEAGLVPKDWLSIENGLCRVEWSCDWQRCVIPKCQTRDHNTLRTQYLRWLVFHAPSLLGLFDRQIRGTCQNFWMKLMRQKLEW